MVGPWLAQARRRYDASLTDTAVPYSETRTWDGAGGFDTPVAAGAPFACRLAVRGMDRGEANLRRDREREAALYYSAIGPDPLGGAVEVEVGGARWSVVSRTGRALSVARAANLREVRR